MALRIQSLWTQRVRAALHRRGARHGRGRPAVQPGPVPAEWDEAFLRVESYLRAHQIESRMLLTRLTGDIIADAQALAAQMPHEAPVTIAMRLAHARIGEWMQRAMGEGSWDDERFRARGRLALLLSELPERCPQNFLGGETLPDDVRKRIAAAQLVSGPEMRPLTMPPAMLEFPLVEIAEAKWVTFSRSAFVRSAASWVLFITIVGAAWYASR
jgi:hypothetical protein